MRFTYTPDPAEVIKLTRSDEIKLAWSDLRAGVKHEIKKIARRLENDAMTELAEQFEAGIERGEILELRLGVEDMAHLLKAQAERIAG
jgi:hypothetical protein